MKYNSQEFDELLNIFKAEIEEIIQKFNEQLLVLEKNPNDKTPIKELFHLAHSIKGSARMIGFNSIQSIAHKLEDILSCWNNDNVKINPESFQIIYNCCDFLYELIDKSVKQKSDCICENTGNFLNELDNLLAKNTFVCDKNEQNLPKQTFLDYIVNKEMDINAILLELMFVLDKEADTTDFENNMEVFRENLEQLDGIFSITDYVDVKDKILFILTFLNSKVQIENIEFLKKCIFELRTVIYNLYKGSNLETPLKRKDFSNFVNKNNKKDSVKLENFRDISANFDFIIKNLQKIRANIDFTKEISKRLKYISDSNIDIKITIIFNKITEIFDFAFNQKQYLNNECYMVVLQSILWLQQLYLQNNIDKISSGYDSILKRLDVVKSILNTNVSSESLALVLKSSTPQELKTIRINTTEVNALIELIDDLSSNIQFIEKNITSDNNVNIDIIREYTEKLRKSALKAESIAKGMKMLPLATLFHAFPRMIRDLAKDNNKKIDLIISGSDTTVDKEIIEKIQMPLIHILRNSVAHGIETPQERINLGKNETGIIVLKAINKENDIIITIEDDGSGINVEKLRTKALQKGLITSDELLESDYKKLIQLLFVSGFSTEDNINEISGRGIGLDIVKTNINKLNGKVFIDSEENKGCKVTIEIPLN